MEPESKKIDRAESASQANGISAVSDTHDEQALDEALRETFPASDPIAVSSAVALSKERPLHQGEKSRGS